MSDKGWKTVFTEHQRAPGKAFHTMEEAAEDARRWLDTRKGDQT